MSDWTATPHTLNTDTATVVAAADHINDLLPNSTPTHHIPRGATFEQLITTADRDAIHALIRRMQ